MPTTFKITSKKTKKSSANPSTSMVLFNTLITYKIKTTKIKYLQVKPT